MFRSKRSVLVRRLLRCRVGCTHGNDSGSSADRESEAETELKAAANSFLKSRLKEKTLELLHEAVESRGGTQTSCVPISKGEIGRKTVAPHVLCCQLFRWPDVKHGSELKRLKFCCETSQQSDEETSGTVCCNPYHISRLCRPESPPPPYSRIAFERSKTQDAEERSLSSVVDYGQSTETGNTPTERRQPYANSSGMDATNGNRRHWCHVAYWEQRTRVGPMYSVFTDSVNIFYDLPHGDGFCLGLLKRDGRPESVAKTRPKIGYGLAMSREDDGVWIYNRSNNALFVNSPALDIPHSRTFTVHKLAPGFSIKIYDHAKSKLLELMHRESEPPDGPVDPNSIRISFIKGWGPHYSRQFITSCPCWIELIMTAPPR